MATKVLARSIFTINSSILLTKQTLSRSYTSASLSSTPSPSFSSFSFFRQRPLVALAANLGRTSTTEGTLREFSTRQTTSSLNDWSTNWSNRPLKETILSDGCDFEHWLVVMEKPENDPTREEIIDSYIKTLAQVVGSEEEARMKIYSVSTRHYFAFGALVSEEVSYKIKKLPKVRWVLPDSYLDVRNKDYGGEPFINGEAVPYDNKYHEEWVRNNAMMNRRASAQNNSNIPGSGNPVVSVPATNLNMGMDLWNPSPAVKMRPNHSQSVPSGPIVPEQCGQDERELKRQKRKQSNRESARRSRLRKQAEYEELNARVETLTNDNRSLRDELQRLSEECDKLTSENTSIKEELTRLFGAAEVSKLENSNMAPHLHSRGDEGNS